MSRFDYVKYDENAIADQDRAKKLVTDLEGFIGGIGYAVAPLPAGVARAKALALTKLEEVYMWIGKALRDDQIARNGSAPLQKERKDG